MCKVLSVRTEGDRGDRINLVNYLIDLAPLSGKEMEVIPEALFVYVDAPLLVLLFASLKSASLLFEGDSMQMYNVFPYIMSSISIGCQIVSFSKEFSPLFTTIETAVNERILHCKTRKLLYLMGENLNKKYYEVMRSLI